MDGRLKRLGLEDMPQKKFVDIHPLVG